MRPEFLLSAAIVLTLSITLSLCVVGVPQARAERVVYGNFVQALPGCVDFLDEKTILLIDAALCQCKNDLTRQRVLDGFLKDASIQKKSVPAFVEMRVNKEIGTWGLRAMPRMGSSYAPGGYIYVLRPSVAKP